MVSKYGHAPNKIDTVRAVGPENLGRKAYTVLGVLTALLTLTACTQAEMAPTQTTVLQITPITTEVDPTSVQIVTSTPKRTQTPNFTLTPTATKTPDSTVTPEPSATPVPVEFPIPIEQSYNPVIPFKLQFNGVPVPLEDWGNHEAEFLNTVKSIGYDTSDAAAIVAIFLPLTDEMNANYNYITANNEAYVAVLPPGEIPLVNGRIDCRRCVFVRLTDKKVKDATIIMPVNGVLDGGAVGGPQGIFETRPYTPDIPGKGAVGWVSDQSRPKLGIVVLPQTANREFLETLNDPNRQGQLVYDGDVVDVFATLSTRFK